jgi:hypothetical protein
VLFDVQRKNPFYFSVKRASIKPFEEYVMRVKFQFDAQVENMPIELCIIGSIETVEQKKGKNDFFLPKFTIVRNCTKEQAMHFSKVRKVMWEEIAEQEKEYQRRFAAITETKQLPQALAEKTITTGVKTYTVNSSVAENATSEDQEPPF